jgi:S1-C subfamily serine protease
VYRAGLVLAVSLLATLATTTCVRAVAASETAIYNPATSTYNYTYTYNTSAPTESNITGWTTGWGDSGITGWNYVGTTSEASAVYLGNGFVLTANHVAASDLILGGQTYDLISGSAEQIGTADLTLYRVDTTSTTGNVLNLPSLNLASTAPSLGSSVVMIGYGNGVGEAWALNSVYETNQSVSLSGSGPTSNDFFTADSFHNSGPNTTTTNNGQLVAGDSGGGAFIYNASTGKWELAGLNEVLLQDGSGKIVGSGMVQIGDYSATIEADMASATAAPEPPSWLLALAGLVTLVGLQSARRPARHAI